MQKKMFSITNGEKHLLLFANFQAPTISEPYIFSILSAELEYFLYYN